MRIGCILEQRIQVGGGFGQQLSTIKLLHKYTTEHSVIFYTTMRENVSLLKTLGISAKYLDAGSLGHKIYACLCRHKLPYQLLNRLGLAWAPFERVLHQDKVDLIYFLSPSWLALSVTHFNYLVTIWDVYHRDSPEFPEVNFNREFEDREYFLKSVLPKAIAVLVDSPHNKDNMVRRYACDAQRVHVAPFLPAIEENRSGAKVDVCSKYKIPRPFIFYPAQFWAHKNHVYILDGLKVLRDKFHVTMDVVFSGSDKGNLKFVLDYAKGLGLEGNVHYVGFIPNEDMTAFYQGATAMVMPTYLGLTNIPPLEAFALGCPVCYSDLPFMKDQVGQAAFLMDLDNPESLASHLMTILNNPKEVRQKIELGRKTVSGWTDKDYHQVLQEIFNGYAQKARCWK
ncbi:MAG: glycosyltransferase family 4 protein [Candidatus Omnitrophica bacterium]|nr:glycosyltransferase family 4 protein [Candidatus Omnitrophota bacterium]